ncbi:lysylphosphatidylglycerol synthase transmembrane domain-containing protein [Saccharothrix mutabilis subsp. mutabilis]|uniref:Lysylphosphatidylglycerol synthase transmembrane domain-containing protein n=1 Tax=Saccharothrix mutabilis subsp. mutabilis TaxID=66855 RepID=A0ABP3CN94_9PSEU
MKGVVRVGLAVVVLGALGAKVGAGAFLDGVRAVEWWSVGAALLIGAVTTLFSALRWCEVARGMGLAIEVRTAVGDYYRGLFLNAVLPAGVLGDVHRAVEHGRKAGDVKRGLRAVVVERVAGQVVLVVSAVAALALWPVDVPGMPDQPVLVAGVVAGIVALGLWRRAREVLSARVVGFSLATTAGHVTLFLVAARTAGVSAPLDELVPLALSALVVMAIPVNVGGFGPREAFLAVAFGATGLGAALGVTTAVVYGVLAFAAGLPGVVPLLQRRQVPREAADQRREQVPALVG